MQQRCSGVGTRPWHTASVPSAPHSRLCVPTHRCTAGAASTETTVNSSASPAAAAAAADEGSSRCPVLAALAKPPEAATTWWQRPMQIFTPTWFQRTAIGNHPVVHVPAALSLPDQYYVANVDLAKQLLQDEAGTHPKITMDDKLVDFVAELFGRTAVVLVPEPRHSFLRNLLMPAFTPEAINRSLPQLELVVQEWLDRWEAAGEPVKAWDSFKALTFDFIMRAVFGRPYPTEEVVRLSGLFKTLVSGFLGWPYKNIPFTPYNRALNARKQLVAALVEGKAWVEAERAAGRSPTGVVANILDAEEALGERLSQEEWEDNLVVLLLAGHDTSSATLTSLMANLQEHPSVLQRLREEQRQVLATHGTQLTAAVLKDMVYADAVIRETLRRDNIVAAISRRTAQEYAVSGYVIPAGAMVQLPLTDLAKQDPRWAESTGDLDPATFNPDRLLTTEGAKQGGSIPFGHGPRFCVGYLLAMAEMKVFLALLCRGYTFTADTKTTWSEAVGKVPANGLPMTISRMDQPLV